MSFLVLCIILGLMSTCELLTAYFLLFLKIGCDLKVNYDVILTVHSPRILP